jgi:hypothetical protein
MGCFLIPRIQVVQVDLLEGVQFPIDSVLGEEDSTGSSLTQWLNFLVLFQPGQLLWLLFLRSWRFPMLHLLRQSPALLHSDRFH